MQPKPKINIFTGIDGLAMAKKIKAELESRVEEPAEETIEENMSKEDS